MVRRAGMIFINQQSPIRRGPLGLLILAASLAPVFAAPSDALLREGAAKIESGLFGRQDLAQVERLLSRTRASGERQALTLLLCRYYRELEEEPLKALPLVAPLVIDPAVRNEWRGRWRPAPGQTGAGEAATQPGMPKASDRASSQAW
jgi:hypothetical protein